MKLLSPTESKRLNEVAGFVFLAIGLLVLFSLVSYRTYDPSWNTAAGNVHPQNLAGYVGSYLADFLLQTFGLAALLFARHPIQVVITGRADDPAALSLEAAANRVYRLGKSVLRFNPTGNAGAPLQELPEALRDTLPHLQADRAVAVVCAGQSCLPPTDDPAQLTAMLENGAAGAAAK